MTAALALEDGTAPIVDALGRLLLHGGHPHTTGSANTVGVEYVAASVGFVGLVGGLLYWYFGRLRETR